MADYRYIWDWPKTETAPRNRAVLASLPTLSTLDVFEATLPSSLFVDDLFIAPPPQEDEKKPIVSVPSAKKLKQMDREIEKTIAAPPTFNKHRALAQEWYASFIKEATEKNQLVHVPRPYLKHFPDGKPPPKRLDKDHEDLLIKFQEWLAREKRL